MFLSLSLAGDSRGRSVPCCTPTGADRAAVGRPDASHRGAGRPFEVGRCSIIDKPPTDALASPPAPRRPGTSTPGWPGPWRGTGRSGPGQLDRAGAFRDRAVGGHAGAAVPAKSQIHSAANPRGSLPIPDDAGPGARPGPKPALNKKGRLEWPARRRNMSPRLGPPRTSSCFSGLGGECEICGEATRGPSWARPARRRVGKDSLRRPRYRKSTPLQPTGYGSVT